MGNKLSKIVTTTPGVTSSDDIRDIIGNNEDSQDQFLPLVCTSREKSLIEETPEKETVMEESVIANANGKCEPISSLPPSLENSELNLDQRDSEGEAENNNLNNDMIQKEDLADQNITICSEAVSEPVDKVDGTQCFKENEIHPTSTVTLPLRAIVAEPSSDDKEKDVEKDKPILDETSNIPSESPSSAVPFPSTPPLDSLRLLLRSCCNPKLTRNIGQPQFGPATVQSLTEEINQGTTTYINSNKGENDVEDKNLLLTHHQMSSYETSASPSPSEQNEKPIFSFGNVFKLLHNPIQQNKLPTKRKSICQGELHKINRKIDNNAAPPAKVRKTRSSSLSLAQSQTRLLQEKQKSQQQDKKSNSDAKLALLTLQLKPCSVKLQRCDYKLRSYSQFQFKQLPSKSDGVNLINSLEGLRERLDKKVEEQKQQQKQLEEEIPENSKAIPSKQNQTPVASSISSLFDDRWRKPSSFLNRCPDCCRLFPDQLSLHKHALEMHSNRQYPFPCKRCARSFLTSKELEDHCKDIHPPLTSSKESSFKWSKSELDSCSETYNTKEEPADHQKLHDLNKTTPSESTQNVQKQETENTEGSKKEINGKGKSEAILSSYNCGKCDKSFPTYIQRKKHIRRYHDGSNKGVIHK